MCHNDLISKAGLSLKFFKGAIPVVNEFAV